jgi:hypothetical protein
MASSFACLSAHDRAAAPACRVPVLDVGAAHPFADLARFRALHPGPTTGQAVGAGQHLQLEVPEQVNAMSERFVKINV